MNIVFITAIVCSIISAAYYLKVIKVLMFDHSTGSFIFSQLSPGQEHVTISPVHSYFIAMITAFLCLFILDCKLILNCTELVALSIYLL